MKRKTLSALRYIIEIVLPPTALHTLRGGYAAMATGVNHGRKRISLQNIAMNTTPIRRLLATATLCLSATAAWSQVGSSPVLSAPPPPRSLPGSATNGTQPVGPVVAGPSPVSSQNYRLAPDDAIQITVWKEPQLSGTYPVRPDGMISMPLLNDVKAAGLTPMELSNEMTEALKKFIQQPLVTVSVVAANSQKVYVLGEVQHVGAVEMSAGMTPLQAISAAGGVTPYASEKHAYILRGPAGHQKKIPFNYKKALKGDPNASATLVAGDTIVVP